MTASNAALSSMEQSQHEVIKASCRELQLLARRHPRVQALMRNLLLRYAERPGFPLRGRRSLQREFTLLQVNSISGGPGEATILLRILDEYPWQEDAGLIAREVQSIARTLKAGTERLREATAREPLAAGILLDQLAEDMLNQDDGPHRLPVEAFRVLFGAISAVNETVCAEALTGGVGDALRLMKVASRNAALKGGIQSWHFPAAFLGLDEQSPSYQRFHSGWITRNDF